MLSVWVCAVLLADAATFTTKVSPVQKVVQLLDELKGKVQGDLATEEDTMSEYTQWCDEEDNTKEDAITSSKRTIGDLQATIQDASATIDDLSSEVQELTAKISADEADLKTATDIREREHDDFAKTEKDLVETTDSLDRAIVVLKRGSFLQRGPVPKELSMLTTSLSKIVEASWVNSHQKAAVEALLQAKEGEDDEDLSLQPQASTAAFSSSSGGILDTLGDMKDKAESTLSDSRKGEMEASHAFQMLKQGLEDEMSTLRKRLGDATAGKTGNEETRASAEADLGATQKTLASDETYLSELRQSCSTKAAEWAQRQKSAAEEIGAIDQAKGILVDGVKAFLQTKSSETSTERKQVAQILRRLSRKFHVYGLTQLAAQAEEGPFGKVKGLIEAMIDRLLKQAAEESDAKAFCDKEVAESKAKQADLSATLDMHATRIESGEAGKAKLLEQIKTLEAEVAEIDKGQAEATALRNKEHEDYAKASSDYKASADAVANAVEVLTNYYSQGSFVQVASKTSRQAPEFGGAKSDIGSTIISMLEVAESDFTRLLSESEAEESAAAAAYDELTQENTVTKASKQEEAKGKQGEVKSLEVALSNYNEDHASTASELDAVLKYLDELKPQCETKVMSYADRKARREQEIGGLKEALAILEG